MKQTLKRMRSTLDGEWYWVATNPFGYKLWAKFPEWIDAAVWLKEQPYYAQRKPQPVVLPS